MNNKIKISILCVLALILIISVFFIASHESSDSEIEDVNPDMVVEEQIKPADNKPESGDREEVKEKINDAPSTESPVPEEDEAFIAPPEDTSEPIVINPEPEKEPYTAFEAYNDMSEAEQKAYYDSFESPEEFFNWYNNAKAEYENSRNDILLEGSTNVEFKP